jgi:serine/threonine protein kinase
MLQQQYMHRGSLRTVLSATEQWQQEYTPHMRHQILYDVAKGMAFLHAQDIFHRDLKRYYIQYSLPIQCHLILRSTYCVVLVHSHCSRVDTGMS